ncbi:MAG: hypothetical protein A4E49_03215 [Methanosaeta sp. PtaU1.Bin112]|nr:MAG: hypothetical protein A4E49_03215 [Methanosaeta sp. PtaU1.Bin112]
MSRGSFKSRLPRGRLGHKVSPALLGVAMFLVVLVASLFYVFPHTPFPPTDFSSSSGSPQHLASSQENSSELSSRLELKSIPSSLSSHPDSENSLGSNSLPNSNAGGGSLLATVRQSPEMSQVYLENTGSAELHEVQIVVSGRSLGVLSEMACGEKKVLAVSGFPENLQVSALDPYDNEVQGRVQYIPLDASEKTTAIVSDDVLLKTKSVAGAEQIASSVSPSASPERDVSEKIPLQLSITANKSEGRFGEVVGYRCLAKNMGAVELSDVKIFCAGKMASTKFLPVGEELVLDEEMRIENSTRLMAGIQAKDASGRAYTNNTSLDIRKVSSFLTLQVSAPAQVHRGEKVNLQLCIGNKGNERLTDILVRDSLGEIGRIDLLEPGSSKVLQKEVTVLDSLEDLFAAFAHDPEGREVYASERFGFKVLNSSLSIRADPSLVEVYPGEPVEVNWILSNNGEEILKNVTLEGDGKRRILKELAPGQDVKMAAIYTKNSTTWINVTAQGLDGNGFEAVSTAGVLLRAARPGITIKLMPPEAEVCPGESAEVTVLVTNSGDDSLDNVVLALNGSTLSSLGSIAPGEFRVVDSKTVISDNCTIQFEARGRDSRGMVLTDSSVVKVSAVTTSLKLFVSSSPPAIIPGKKNLITCTVANTGIVPLYSIFVISKKLGPLGSIDYLSPKRQMTVEAEKIIDQPLDDIITAEGFTQDKRPVRCTFGLILKPLSSPGQIQDAPEEESLPSGVTMASANITFGNVSLPFDLPAQEETESKVSGTMADDVDRSATGQNNAVLEKIAGLLRYVEELLGLKEGRGAESGRSGGNESQPTELSPAGKESLEGSKDYELSIEGVKGSEHGAITIMDVNAQPTTPAANEPVKVTVHLQSQDGIRSASVKYGLSEMPLTRNDMLSVDRVYDCALSLESGSIEDGYWSGTIPGRGAGTYMPLSVVIAGESGSAEGGPYLIHWSTIKANKQKTVVAPSGSNGMLFIESSSVKGKGEVTIKDTISGSTMQYNEKIMGNGSISLETLRTIERSGGQDNFTEKKDLVFTDGSLKGHKTVASPNFQGGLGASVTERFNLSHVDKSETSSVKSSNLANNTLAYKTDQAFDGTWNIQTRYAKFYKKIKADQQYTGSFQTQKDITFTDAGQK